MPKEVSVFVYELHPNLLAIHIFARHRVNGVHPDHQPGFIERDFRAPMLRRKELNHLPWQPRLDGFEQRTLADVMPCAEAYPFNLEDPAVGELCAGDRAGRTGKQTPQAVNARDENDQCQAAEKDYTLCPHVITARGIADGKLLFNARLIQGQGEWNHWSNPGQGRARPPRQTPLPAAPPSAILAPWAQIHSQPSTHP